MTRNKYCEGLAKETAQTLPGLLGIPSCDTALICNPGFHRLLDPSSIKFHIPLMKVLHFSYLRELEYTPETEPYLAVVRIANKLILLVERVHVFDIAGNPNIPVKHTGSVVRLLNEMTFHFGVTTLLVFSRVGALPQPHPRLTPQIGDLTVFSDFVTKYAPQLPLFANDQHRDPVSIISGKLLDRAKSFRPITPTAIHFGTHVMVQGPLGESKLDKKGFAEDGGLAVGMSTLDSVAVVGLYDDQINVLPFGIVASDWLTPHDHAQININTSGAVKNIMAFVAHLLQNK